jgi:hypothetical protein
LGPKAIAILLLLSSPAPAWDCPACGEANGGQICTRCFLPEVPSGMVYIPACSVVLDGDTVSVEPFFVDASFTTYRQVLPWMNSTITTLDQLATVLTGQFDENLQFLRYTPITGSSDSSGMTVPSTCLDMPACSFTRTGAEAYLLAAGKRLPTVAELAAVDAAGIIERIDVYDVMSGYASMMTVALGEMLGRLQGQAMFAGYSTADERVLWEWTSDVPGAPDPAEPCGIIYRHTGTGIAVASCGYFNVAFRGAVTLPQSLASE